MKRHNNCDDVLRTMHKQFFRVNVVYDAQIEFF